MRPRVLAALVCAATLCGGGAMAGDAAADLRSVDQDVQSLKKDLVDLNRDLFRLEEELLYPASTQVAVFLSLNVGTFFDLDSVKLELDDKEVANYLYTEREVQALHRGGVQKLFLGNLKAGEHELVAVFTGKGPHERDYRRGTTLKFEKAVGAKYVELRISDREASLQPEFVVRQWE
ncbi:MAG: AraC family transcriptional regulator [Steroidobacteraceae bacterium]|nr:AraC family transcriptional regulator [Steroidobacteraceae bacterium]